MGRPTPHELALRSLFTLASPFSACCLPRRSLAQPCAGPSSARNVTRVQFSARRRAALSPRVCSLHSAQRLIYFTLPDLSAQPKTSKRPPWDAAGASDASFQGNLACLLLGYAGGRVQSACGGCSPSEWNRRARCGRFNLCGDAVARTDCLAPESLTG